LFGCWLFGCWLLVGWLFVDSRLVVCLVGLVRCSSFCVDNREKEV